MQKPSVFVFQRDSKNDSIFGARRELQRRIPPCTELHGRYRTPKQLARNAKNPVWFFSTGFKKLTERTGAELFDVFPMFLGCSKVTY